MSSIIEYLRHVPLPENTKNILSVQWWLEYLYLAYNEDPIHVMIELTALAIIIFLLVKPRYDPKKKMLMSVREQEELIAEWEPEPLEPPMSNIESPNYIVNAGVDRVAIINNKEVINFTSGNFTGLARHPEIFDACKDAIEKYGVGSCGPRGFYGTIDVHLKLEEDLCKFFGAESCIVYSDGIACISSVIPTFAKRGDLIICDEGVHYGIQQGLNLTRSNIIYFKHNDMDDLERILKELQPKELARKQHRRRFIIVEGVYQNYGDICPLKQIIKLKNKYRYRLIFDDTYGIGVLGASGRGSIEHWSVSISDIEAHCGSLDMSIGSVGGFCIGEKGITSHQRLAGAGYVFSASAPPYTATAASKALNIIDREPNRTAECRRLAVKMRKLLNEVNEIIVVGGIDCESPLIHLHLATSFGSWDADNTFFRLVEGRCMENGIAVYSPQYVPQERVKPTPSLRILVTLKHTDDDLLKAQRIIRESLEWAFSL